MTCDAGKPLGFPVKDRATVTWNRWPCSISVGPPTKIHERNKPNDSAGASGRRKARPILGSMTENRPVRPPLLPTALVAVAVVLLLFLAANAAFRLLTLVVEVIVVVIAVAVMAWVGRYLWRRGRSA